MSSLRDPDRLTISHKAPCPRRLPGKADASLQRAGALSLCAEYFDMPACWTFKGQLDRHQAHQQGRREQALRIARLHHTVSLPHLLVREVVDGEGPMALNKKLAQRED